MDQSRVHVGNLSTIRPTVNFANRSVSLPGQQWGPRTIPDSQLLYVVSGSAVLTLGNQQIHLAAGDCVFYGSNSPHKIISSVADPSTLASIHFSWDQESPKPISPIGNILACSDNELTLPTQTYTIDVDGYGNFVLPNHFVISDLESYFNQVIREYRFEEKGYATTLRGLMMQLLVVIIRHQINGYFSSTDWRKIAPALEAIRKQPQLDWTIAELANLCGYHPVYFTEIFKETIGYSPKRYLILERIRKAKQYLLEAESIEKVADLLGYSSIHYFSRSFKEITGYTPTEFKQLSIHL
ncbi:AraC family transcriptional regulator [Paenibacillus chungangensis]|uniref:AraC family transcriptional regulator n=1 Tax=Paenibacillus chungangensis TaxID=696535 RepID=A0ABW3HRI0_9BACL